MRYVTGVCWIRAHTVADDVSVQLEKLMKTLDSGFSQIETLVHQEIQLGEDVGMSVAQLAGFAAGAGGSANPTLYSTAGVLIENIFCLIQNTVETVKVSRKNVPCRGTERHANCIRTLARRSP